MTKTVKLSYHPRPFADESISGYSLRLAFWHGFMSLAVFARQCFGFAIPTNLRRNSIETSNWISILDPATRFVARQHLVECDDAKVVLPAPVRGQLIRELFIPTPRLCVCCLNEHGYFKVDWQHAQFIVCPTHKVAIIDCCPNCWAPFKWHSTLMEGCEACSLRWQEQKPQLLASADRIVQLQSNTKLIPNFTNAFLRVAQPLGLTHWECKGFPYSAADHFEMASTAYSLTSDGLFNREFAKASIASVSNLTVLAGPVKAWLRAAIPDLLADKLTCAAIQSPSEHHCFQGLKAVPELALPKRYLGIVGSLENSHYFLASDELRQLLGIKIAELNQLVDADILSCSNRGKPVAFRLYDLREVDKSLQKLLQRACPYDAAVDCFNWADAVRLAFLFGLSWLDVLSLCVECRVEFYVQAGRGFDVFTFGRSSLLKAFASTSSGLVDRLLTRSDSLKLLNITSDALDWLALAGLLGTETSASRTHFSRTDLFQFLAGHRVARREAVLANKTVRACWLSILSCGCSSVLESINGGTLIGIAAKPIPL